MCKWKNVQEKMNYQMKKGLNDIKKKFKWYEKELKKIHQTKIPYHNLQYKLNQVLN